jgi:SAM-dependent methyltransferase
VLEIGSGDGRWLELFTRSGARPYGIDILPKAAGSAGLSGFSACVGDARDLPFPDDHFDLTLLFGVFEHLEGTERAISGQTRVTKPGAGASSPSLISILRGMRLSWLCGTQSAEHGNPHRQPMAGCLARERFCSCQKPCRAEQVEAFYLGALYELRPFLPLRKLLPDRLGSNSLEMPTGYDAVD